MKRILFASLLFPLNLLALAQAQTPSLQEDSNGSITITIPGGSVSVNGQDKIHAPVSMTVVGVAKEEVKPDTAYMTLGVTSDGATAQEASKKNAEAATKIIANLKTMGVEAKDIQTSQVRLEAERDAKRDPRTHEELGQYIVKYRADNILTVKIRDLDKAGALIAQATDNGANDFRGVRFDISDATSRMDRLRAEAIKDAKRRAEICAAAANMKLGRLIQLAPDFSSEIRPFDRPQFATMARAAVTPDVPVESGVETLSASASEVWELLPQ